MKVAISLPDPLYKRADREARKRKLSRSGFVAEALAEYFRRQDGGEVTAAINQHLAALTDEEKARDEQDRDWLRAAAHKTLSGDTW